MKIILKILYFLIIGFSTLFILVSFSNYILLLLLAASVFTVFYKKPSVFLKIIIHLFLAVLLISYIIYPKNLNVCMGGLKDHCSKYTCNGIIFSGIGGPFCLLGEMKYNVNVIEDAGEDEIFNPF